MYGIYVYAQLLHTTVVSFTLTSLKDALAMTGSLDFLNEKKKKAFIREHLPGEFEATWLCTMYLHPF